MPTISIQSNWIDPGDTNILFLLQNGVITNTGGDILTHIDNGFYTCNVSETLSGDYDVLVSAGGTPLLESVLYDGETKVSKQNFTEINDLLEDILVALTIVQSVPLDQTTATHLRIIRGDAYDGVSRPKFTWDVGQSVDTLNFVSTFKDKVDGTALISVNGVGVGNIIELELTSTETEMLPPTPKGMVGFTSTVFDIEVDMGGGSFWTPIFGTYEVIGDVTLPLDR